MKRTDLLRAHTVNEAIGERLAHAQESLDSADKQLRDALAIRAIGQIVIKVFEEDNFEDLTEKVAILDQNSKRSTIRKKIFGHYQAGSPEEVKMSEEETRGIFILNAFTTTHTQPAESYWKGSYYPRQTEVTTSRSIMLLPDLQYAVKAAPESTSNGWGWSSRWRNENMIWDNAGYYQIRREDVSSIDTLEEPVQILRSLTDEVNLTLNAGRHITDLSVELDEDFAVKFKKQNLITL